MRATIIGAPRQRGRFRALARLALILLALALIASTGYGHTAGSSLTGSPAGGGAGSVSGYTVTEVSFAVDPLAPDELNEVSFSIAPASAETVRVQLAPDGPWHSCRNEIGSASCPLSPSIPVASVTALAVVAFSG